MADKTLLRSQKNEVFRLIEKTGLGLGGFTWQTILSTRVGG